MLVYIHTCEHCGKEYHYQASGAGCHDTDNNEHLCPDCMHVVLQALKNIPVKFRKCWLIRNEDFAKEEISKIIKKGEDWYKHINSKNNGFPITSRIITSNTYKHFIEFVKDNHLYRLLYNSDGDYELKAEVYINKETGQFDRYAYHKESDVKIKSYTNCVQLPSAKDIPVVDIGKPIGRLFFNDIL